MQFNKEKMEELLCSAFCANIRLREVAGEVFYFLETPFSFPDGDSLSLYLVETNYGFRITDFGHTFMHLSYNNDVDIFFEGTRGKLLGQILAEFGVVVESGELRIDSSPSQIVDSLFRIGQAITRITDLTFLNRARVASTFYEDLYKTIVSFVPPEKVRKDYIVPDVEDGIHYTVDYKIEGKDSDIFLFGIPSRDKAKDTATTLEHLLRFSVPFDSILVFEDQETIPRIDVARLSNVGGEMVSSLNADRDLKRKLLRRVSLNGSALKSIPKQV